ncbi:MAG: pyridoxamine 5'-phosphate oxidase family protein [Gammaproteobacteria bacterium]|nr:pyridoxamine 5'-phosphate oxidase family protein [Gammaproteobacteria bacterium]
MNLKENWAEVVNVLRAAKKSNLHFSIATVDKNGDPHVTPIGHVFFRDDMTGYYFDAYSKAMPKNFQGNKRVCLMGVNSGSWFWFKALLQGEFKSPPAVRVYGEVGELRPASEDKLAQYRKSINATRRLKGHKLLWADLDKVRDINFTSFSPATYPVMCENLWR